MSHQPFKVMKRGKMDAELCHKNAYLCQYASWRFSKNSEAGSSYLYKQNYERLDKKVYVVLKRGQ
jgi:hypothetical protein